MRFRVFAALELPPANQAQLGEVLAGLQAAVPPGTVRWVRPENMHLTLKFYGDVAAEALPPLQAALAQAAGRARALQLTIAGLGVFPNPRRPQVIWAGLAGELDGLRALQYDLEALSAGLGYAPEGREYKPHLTLGRVSGSLRPAEHLALMEQLSVRRSDMFGAFNAEVMGLVRSDLRPTGPVYNLLFAAPLGSRHLQSHAHI